MVFHLGDVVSGVYHGVSFVGVLRSYDGSGYAYVRFPAPHAKPVIYGTERDGIALDPHGGERRSLKLVSRPDVQPEVEAAPWQVLGGAYLVNQ